MDRVRRLLADPLAAIQFLTRIPVPAFPFSAGTLPRSLAYFPLVGLLLAWLAGVLHRVLLPHLPRPIAATIVIGFLVAVTGAFHEDALADCADAFGLSRPVDRTLEIMRDSRIGSFGGAALALSISGRILMIAALPADRVVTCLIVALTLGRWSTLPLSLLPGARGGGQGVQVAGRAPGWVLGMGTAFMVVIVGGALRWGAVAPVTVAAGVVGATGAYYRRRIGGVTGDCFGATNQLVEMAVLVCMLWVR